MRRKSRDGYLPISPSPLRCERQIVRVFFNRHSFGIVVSKLEDDETNHRSERSRVLLTEVLSP
jgi:hypothetical protein